MGLRRAQHTQPLRSVARTARESAARIHRKRIRGGRADRVRRPHPLALPRPTKSPRQHRRDLHRRDGRHVRAGGRSIRADLPPPRSHDGGDSRRRGADGRRCVCRGLDFAVDGDFAVAEELHRLRCAVRPPASLRCARAGIRLRFVHVAWRRDHPKRRRGRARCIDETAGRRIRGARLSGRDSLRPPLPRRRPPPPLPRPRTEVLRHPRGRLGLTMKTLADDWNELIAWFGSDQRIAIGIFVLAFVTFGWFSGGAGWNQNAHFDLTRALVERGTLYIDGYESNTGDVSKGSGGHTYINKPPAASFLAALPYAIVHAVAPRFNAQWLVTALTCGVCGALIGPV